MPFSKDEQKLVKHTKESIAKYNRLRQSKGGIDTLYSFVMSESGKIYDGACLESSVSAGAVCAERHAIANMILAESYSTKIKHIVVADPVPRIQKNSTAPCGTCRHVIWEMGPEATVILIQYVRQKSGWAFPKIEKRRIRDLYPSPYIPVKWE